jgi:hypothetical protein
LAARIEKTITEMAGRYIYPQRIAQVLNDLCEFAYEGGDADVQAARKAAKVLIAHCKATKQAKAYDA